MESDDSTARKAGNGQSPEELILYRGRGQHQMKPGVTCGWLYGCTYIQHC